jgi:hypothetical protein
MRTNEARTTNCVHHDRAADDGEGAIEADPGVGKLEIGDTLVVAVDVSQVSLVPDRVLPRAVGQAERVEVRTGGNTPAAQVAEVTEEQVQFVITLRYEKT